MDLRNLSDEADRNASNPYPIYNAIEKDCFTNGPIEGKWFELSPHEAGFTELGFFIETSLLGSKFQDGELLEKKPEMDMVKLQGILVSALAHEDIIREYIPTWMNVLGHIDDTAEEYLRVHTVLEKLVALTRSTTKNPTALTDLDTLQNILEGKWFELSPHEAGFTELGFFIETSLLGSKFQDGELLEKKPEMDMVKLQGVCSQVEYVFGRYSCFRVGS
ncbi:cytosolic phospholipase A2 gamma-like [Larimichthys crocea]|uniref:cytosolic phospholipase A2 gamma-like n=1 Tax=Larimichthys crocea TaxID=215358 RepID=UPI000F5D81EC|nr:cytosolic phospholipase A2 gamma-like [Larimichthys crocea]